MKPQVHDSQRQRAATPELREAAPLASTLRRYLLTVDRRHPDARRELRDVQKMHARLCALVDLPRSEARMLHRIERDRVIVQAAVPLALETLPPGYLIHAQEQAVRLDWPAGAAVRYRLLAAPVVAKVQPSGRSKRRAITDPDGLAEWIDRKLRLAGLDGLDVQGWLRGAAHGRREGAAIVIGRTLFEGAAIVRDPAALATAITTGIGPGKAYGLGLLTLEEIS